jgi:chemotaxis protein histidine kinase CheA
MSTIISEIPSASVVIGSASAVVVASQEEVMDLTDLIAQAKSLDSSDLFKLMKAMLTEAEKKAKSVGKPAKAEKKAGSMPKGVVPPQLRRPKAWVNFVQEYCKENGWESFVVSTTKKDKVTGEKITEEIEMPASELHEGVYVFEGSVTAAQPKGKSLIQKDAMSLSKQMWSAKEKVGTHEELYNEFLSSYTDTIVAEEDTMEVVKPAKAAVVRKTAAEKEAEAAEKKAAKEAEKAEKAAKKAEEKAAKEAEKAALKEAKEAEKAAKKAEKEAEKEAKKSSPKSSPKAPAKAAKAAEPKATPVKTKEVKVPAAPKKPAVKKAVEAWSCPADGAVYDWTFKGKKYLRNSDNQVWLKNGDECGEWQGVYDVETDSIDDSAEEPADEMDL